MRDPWSVSKFFCAKARFSARRAASGRGVAVLPDWVVREVRYNSDYVTRPLTKNGKTKRLYAATRVEDTHKPFMSNVIRLARTEPLKLQRS